MTLRIATYNIHRCIGRDGIEAPERIAAVLRDINADVMALQEVSFNNDGPNDILANLARATDAQAIAGPTLLEQKGHYGNAILSRIAPDSVDRMDISVPGREPRGAISIKLRFNGSTVRIVATHLGLRPGERRYQMRRLLPLLEDLDAAVTILLGDFNEWFLWGRPLRWANRRFGSIPAPATFPSRRPLLALDRIWVDPAERLISLHHHRHTSAAIASDHLPLVARAAV
ncbi:endonuclease/exonuclease/phosphatase family protein [uncultured Desulfosarcina sp.]|uniref:endonuclease/exonuclease/phosphatase family protein n=1 Tax=uncultured Desulfosarcina sp. TaxID=218289 RepID=UPI0029C88A97|nr:endonuclease/exonuclease/phosphatase family protein [uncultured Desulfosarcina sp.]